MDIRIDIENYEIMGLLGRGGMSTVWKARQQSLDRLVAIKILAPGLATDPTDVERFNAEARAAALLKHPGIVQVYDASLSNGSYYFVMELIDGYTVGEWLRRKNRLPESDVLVLAESIATAMDYAWTTFGMVHCDIKPDNVMIDADGSVKITDLGLARVLSSLSNNPDDEVAGTPPYMSPEQVQGAPELDCRADIYSLGAMLYHLATGRMLFEGESEERQMELQVEGYVTNPATLCPSLSHALCVMISRMLVKDPRYRYPDWKSVLRDLQRVKKRLPLRTPNRLSPSTVRRMTRRRAVRANRPSSLALPPGSRSVPEYYADSRATTHPPANRGRLTALFLLAGMAVAAVGLRMSENRNRPDLADDMTYDTALFPLPTPKDHEQSADEALRLASLAAFRSAREWERNHPDKLAEAVSRYRAVTELFPDTEAARMARAAEANCLARMRQGR